VPKGQPAKDPAAKDPAPKGQPAKVPAPKVQPAKDPAAKDPAAKDAAPKDAAAKSQPAKDPAAKRRDRKGQPGKERGGRDRAARREELQRELKALKPSQKRDLIRVNRFVLGFGAVALLAMITLTMPLPWPAAGLAALVAAAALGIRGIRLARRTPLARGAVMYLALGLGLLGMFTLYSIPLVTTWEEQWDYQQCLGQTQTIEGRDACYEDYQKATEADWRQILQRVGG
jgi:hypothetical protein